ncbi:hypothetical protein PAPYR_13268 [Paratrimastix pyriformis]|uniref:Uncharacterized protein n=1 Tax=Paratrimastix pyriformis TaxID=342808 RepID=A0ABQ8U415_9EUKA|nr:hypothetical protein PAPYR_13268 [Paratrimastix pyriformis]
MSDAEKEAAAQEAARVQQHKRAAEKSAAEAAAPARMRESPCWDQAIGATLLFPDGNPLSYAEIQASFAGAAVEGRSRISILFDPGHYHDNALQGDACWLSDGGQ